MVTLVKEDNAIWVTIKTSSDVLRYIIYKGSVAIDGISLTVAYVDDETFKVSIIPHTLEKTIFNYKVDRRKCKYRMRYDRQICRKTFRIR